MYIYFADCVNVFSLVAGPFGPKRPKPGPFPPIGNLPHKNDSIEGEQQEVIDTNKKQVRTIRF